MREHIHNNCLAFRQALLAALLALFSLFSQAADILSADERAWLKAHPDITLAMWEDYEPISYFDTDGLSKGYMADYMQLLESRLNYRFKQVKPAFQGGMKERWRVTNADIVSLEAITPIRAQYYSFTSPAILTYPLYLISRNGVSDHLTLNNLRGKRLSVVAEYATQEFVEMHYPQVNLDIVENTCEGLQHVAFGQAEAMLTDLPIAAWCLKNLGLINLKVAGKTEFTYEMSMAVRKDWPVMLSILQKGMRAIPADEVNQLHQLWLSQEVFERSWLDKHKLLLGILALIVLCLVTLTLYSWDSRLQRRILLANPQEVDDKVASIESNSIRYKHKFFVTGILSFLALLALISGLIITQYDWRSQNDRLLLLALSASMALITLYGGYKLGSAARTRLVESLMQRLTVQIKSRQASEQKVMSTAERLERQNAAISKISVMLRNDELTDAQKYQQVTKVCAHALVVDRVGLWMLSDNNTKLHCVDLFELKQDRHSANGHLLAKDYPAYFKALAANRTLAVEDAELDPDTCEFAKDYLPANNIGAILDSTIWFSGQIIGVLCFEHVGNSREWTLDEITFAGAIADSVQAQIESSRRKLIESDLEYQQKHLETLIRARTASIESNAKLSRFLVDKAPVSIVYLNSALDIIEVNPETERMSGLKREGILGKNYLTLVRHEEREEQRAIFERVIRGEKVLGQRVSYLAADGRQIELSVSRSMELDSDGNPVIISISQDVSQQKALEESLIRAREAAESADRIKSMFVASMSHELRTPLNSIIGFLGVVLQGMSGTLNDIQKDQLGRAYNSAKHLLSLISDVIDISKIEAGYLHVRAEKFELKPLLLEAEQSIHHLSEEKKLELSVECKDQILLESDRKRLYQVVLNVLSNAVKYTEKGWVKLTASAHKGLLTITVEDSGIGIAEADIPKLFQPFERVDSRLKIKILGTGLGLYLTKKILTQLLGGDINVQSKAEVGSTFTLTLPLKIPKKNDTDISVLEFT